MLSAKKYYQYLYEHFILQNNDLFKKCDIKAIKSSEEQEKKLENILQLLDGVCEKYEFNMQRMCKTNYKMLSLWQMNFCGQINEEELIIAVEFIVFCCLADKILDSQRFTLEEKEGVCQKLEIRNFINSKEYRSSYFSEMDILLNDIRIFFNTKKTRESPYFSLVLKKMELAFESEQYMYRSILKNYENMEQQEIHLLIDKSVEFQATVFLIASLYCNNNNTENAATTIAELFWIIDDLCDFVVDIKCGRKNSLLFYHIYDDNLTLEQRIENVYENLNYYIQYLEELIIQLKEVVNEELYQNIINQIWDWCSDVRKMAEEKD